MVTIPDHPLHLHIISTQGLQNTFTPILPQSILVFAKSIWNFTFRLLFSLLRIFALYISKLILITVLNLSKQHQNPIIINLCFISHHCFLKTITFPFNIPAFKKKISSFLFLGPQMQSINKSLWLYFLNSSTI